MPSVITSPVGTGIVNQSYTIFDYPDTPATSILSLQANPTQPLPSDLATATGQITPDQLIQVQLSNFYPGLYDLTPGSHLMNLMTALLGPSGAGQYRTRNTIAILQTALSSTNFYDLDSFYGALFGALRGPSGSLPVNTATGSTVDPYNDLASQDGWDLVAAIDASFRERVIRLARAIALGGTIPGLRALAEALAQVPCDVYQIGQLVTQQAPESGGNTWGQAMTDWPAWNDFSGTVLWGDVQGSVTYGGMAINALNEIVVQPRKSYDLTSQAGLQEYGADVYGIQRVLNVLKPAGTLITVSAQGAAVNTLVTPGSLYSPDDGWSVSTRILPSEPASPAYAQALTAYDPAGPQPGAAAPVPVPPLTGQEGGSWSYSPLVTSVQAQSVLNGVTESSADYETEKFLNGSLSWLPGWALISPAKAAAAHVNWQASSAPYSGSRVPVVTAG